MNDDFKLVNSKYPSDKGLTNQIIRSNKDTMSQIGDKFDNLSSGI